MNRSIQNPALALALLCLVPLLAPPASGAGADEPLLSDDYTGLELGMFSGGVVGALTEYHFLPAASAPRGNWVVSVFRTDGSQRAWRVIADAAGGERFMHQSYTAASAEREYMHPTVIAGDELWSDYTMETKFAPEGQRQADGNPGMNGILFRYRNDRRYYFAGVAGQTAVLKKVDQGVAFRKLSETVLAERPLAWKPGEFIPVRISVSADQLRATVGDVTLEARDATFAQGKIGLAADTPTRFGAVRVTCPAETKQMIDTSIRQRQAEEDQRVAGNPRMVLWKKFSTSGFGVGRNLRFGDLDGDGQLDVLVAQQKRHGPADGYSEVGCMTAMTFDGKRLWQNGLADSWNHLLTSDVAVQIHDLDGDGKTEVVYCRDFEVVVADGATGETKYKAPTPEAPTEPGVLNRSKRFPRILGDSMAFADLRGTGQQRDILLKDRYRNVWALNEKLEQLWTLKLNTGHYPFPYDIDGDGRDEIAIGYSLLSPDGKIIWTNQDKLEDHADGVAVVRFREDLEPRLLCAASDEGMFFSNLQGKIEQHYQLGHVQNPSVADYRPDLPGLETVTVNFWGNQGIVHFFDAEGHLYHDCEPSQHGSMMMPVNWTGNAGEYWALSPSRTYGGLFDGWGRRVVRFPADGHPDQCLAVLDLNGDCRDEIVVWDPWEIWVYTQSDNPKNGKLYKPKRNPLFNYSNYQATVSLPGWSQ